jgi:hypothetical protein
LEELNDRETDTQTDKKWASIGGREPQMVNYNTQTVLFAPKVGELNKTGLKLKTAKIFENG